jgi:acyl carrier protein
VTQDDVKAKLTEIFRSVFDDDSITLSRETTANDIEEWDSLNQIKIILAAQEEFGFKMDVKKINSFQNVGQMLDYLVGETANRG